MKTPYRNTFGDWFRSNFVSADKKAADAQAATQNQLLIQNQQLLAGVLAQKQNETSGSNSILIICAVSAIAIVGGAVLYNKYL